ncbi:MAG: helix-turn-helix transcriptional regulator [Syntrophobacterales bacterium]|jgi:transcriptional regulator with XRE-family HTH domain
MSSGTQNKIKQIRLRLGLSQKEFADKIGITKGYLSAIESDKRQPGRKIFEGIIQECLEDLVAVYSEKLEAESARLQVVAELGPEWREEDSSVELTPPEQALIRAIRFLGDDYAKDLFYRVMSRARRLLPGKQMSKEEVEELRAVLRTLGKAAIE